MEGLLMQDRMPEVVEHELQMVEAAGVNETN